MDSRELSQLQRDAAALIESLQRDWTDIGNPDTLPGAREGIRLHIQWALEELQGLWRHIEKLDT